MKRHKWTDIKAKLKPETQTAIDAGVHELGEELYLDHLEGEHLPSSHVRQTALKDLHPRESASIPARVKSASPRGTNIP